MDQQPDLPLPDIWSLIEKYIDSQPDHKAIVSTKMQLTYGQLKLTVEKLGELLHSSLPQSYQNPSQPRCVILHAPNSVAYVTFMLTCTKLGRPFTPLPVDWPKEKQDMVLADVRGAAVITTRSIQEQGKFPNARVLATVSCDDFPFEEDFLLLYLDQNEGDIQLEKDCCYVIYTSGSTGRPKGVQCLRSGVTNMALGQNGIWSMGPDDVMGQFASVAYDAVISECFATMTAGATLAVLYMDQRLGVELEDTVQALGITLITFVPSLLQVLEPEDFPTISKLVSAGEACTFRLAKKWFRDGAIRFFNAYGPAENTVMANGYELTKEKLAEEEVKGLDRGLPIGGGFRGVILQLLDENMEEVAQGSEGQIYIGGLSLSKGYIGHAAELTADRFVSDPRRPERLLYRTGDLAFMDSNGDLVFQGRVDNQLKIRGQMVNLEGVESHILGCPGVTLAGVVCLDGPELVAALAPSDLDLQNVKKTLASKLSSHEIPSRFHSMDEEDFPRNNSDKIDRKELAKILMLL